MMQSMVIMINDNAPIYIRSTKLSDHSVDIRTSGIQEHREEPRRNVEYPADIAVCGYNVRSSFYIISI